MLCEEFLLISVLNLCSSVDIKSLNEGSSLKRVHRKSILRNVSGKVAAGYCYPEGRDRPWPFSITLD